MMSKHFTVEKIERSSTDTILLGVVVLLAGLGISMLFSSSYYYASRLFGDTQYFLRRQIIWMVLGSAAAFVVFHLPLGFVRACALPLVVVSLVLTCLTFVPGIGTEVMGARRWIFVYGHSFQPSELVKLSLILYLSHILSKREEEAPTRVDDFVNSLLPLIIVVILLVLPVYLQNDFSTAFFILFIAFMYLFLAGVRAMYFAGLSLIAVPLSFILLFTKEHRVLRLITFLDPSSDPAGAGYQVIASQDALMRGGFWGVGLGQGVKKLGGLPEAHSDFIFAVLGEEAGFLGVMFILFLFIMLGVRGFRIAEASETRFCFYMASGVTATILFQAFLNMAVVSGLVPATGIPLPFFSSGGSSILVTLSMCGLLFNISKNDRKRKEDVYG